MHMKNLEKLRVLTQNISLQEEKRIQELSLYQSFFEQIPLKTFVWSVDEKMRIRVKNKKSLKENLGERVLKNGSLKDAFTCQKMNELNIKYHEAAMGGSKQTYLSYEDETTFLTTLIPVIDAGERIVYGCSWDVSSIIEIMDAVKILPESCSGIFSKIIDKNPIYKLVEELRLK